MGIVVSILDQEQYDSGPFDFGASYVEGSLARVRASLEQVWLSVPEEFREVARCEINSVSGYEGSHYARIEVSYVRPETKEELAAREAERVSRLEATERAERRTYEALRSKFETPTTE